MRGAVMITALAGLLAGCFPGGSTFGDCREDFDCPSNQQCTRTRECVGGTLIEARITWTIGGAAVNPQSAAACEGFDHLEISFGEDGLGDITYSPVPCNLGFAVYDKMPPRLERVSLTGFDSRGAYIDGDSTDLSPGENLITFDLMP